MQHPLIPDNVAYAVFAAVVFVVWHAIVLYWVVRNHGIHPIETLKEFVDADIPEQILIGCIIGPALTLIEITVCGLMAWFTLGLFR